MKRGAGISLLVLYGAAGCADQGLEQSQLPEAGARFEPVSEMLGASCGSLDCHGDSVRNLRLYHQNGLRLATDDIVGGDETTPEEHEQNFVAVVLLEPELLEEVVLAAGADPERLTLVRKARASEDHVGGAALSPDADRCLISWLQGSVDVDSCTASVARAAQEPR